jgi:RNA polymerase sigma-70 factor (ECF subfamily)
MESDPPLDADSSALLRLSRPLDVEAALAGLYSSHFRKFETYFRLALRSPDLAEDLVHETFMRAHNHRAQFQGEAKLSTWVWSIARNTLFEHLRKHRHERLHVEGDSAESDPRSETPPHLSELGDCVRRGLERFFDDEPERAHVIYLAYVEELTREELAAAIGRSAGAATEYLSQCKKKFRPYIEDCHDC